MSDTKSTKKKKPVGNIESDLRARHWFLTWNNYELDYKSILKELMDTAEKYIFQPEVGEETGTPHIQGVFSFKHPVKWSIMTSKSHPKCKWNKCRSKFAVGYCGKEHTRTGPTECKGYKVQVPEIKEFRPWQKVIVDICSKAPDDRSIIWIYDEKGGNGKTKLCRHLLKSFKNCIYVSGKANDMKYAIAQRIKEDKDITLCLMNFTRSLEEHVSYEGIESIKDGIFFSGKYESESIIYDPPHVVCFANFLPKKDALSKDRWKIGTLSDAGLVFDDPGPA